MENQIKTLVRCEKCDIFMLEGSYRNHIKTYKHTMDKVEYKEKLRQMGMNSILQGDENEIFLLEVLKTLDFEDVAHQGYTGNKFDVFVKLFGESFYRGIQIKTLTYYPNGGYYEIPTGRGYEKNALIIAVCNDRTKYALIFYGETKENTIFYFPPTSDKLITDLNVFKTMISEAVRKSTVVTDFSKYLTIDQKQEFESINRFKVICQFLNIPFQHNNINTNEIDAIVNGYNIQFKSSRNLKTYAYQFAIGRRTNDDKLKPYSIDDNIDFFIFEIVTEKYQNNFYIISKDVLIKTGHVSTPNNAGKITVNMTPYSHGKEHWTLNFLNKFDQITSGEKISIPIYNKLHQILINMDFFCQFGKNNIFTAINSKNVRLIKHAICNKSGCQFDLRITKNNASVTIHVNDNYEFIIFDFGDLHPNKFCIIPTSVLVQRGYIATNIDKGRTKLTIQHIDPNPLIWTNYYMNNFELLV